MKALNNFSVRRVYDRGQALAIGHEFRTSTAREAGSRHRLEPPQLTTEHV